MTGALLIQAADVTAVYNERLAIVFGFVTLVFVVSVFLSCRVLPRLVAMVTPKKPFSSLLYMAFYKYHAYSIVPQA
jgi:hypothetical protein